MFKKIYATRLDFGDKTSLAYQTGHSEEYISKLTRYGGVPCPTERDWKWLCDLYHVNTECAIAVLDELNARFAEMRLHTAADWHPHRTAASLVKRAADTVAALISECPSDDEQALVDLKLAVETAITECRQRRMDHGPKLKGVAR